MARERPNLMSLVTRLCPASNHAGVLKVGHRTSDRVLYLLLLLTLKARSIGLVLHR